MTEKIVYINKVPCKCWSLRRDKYTADVVTYIVERQRLWHKSYEIKQVIPLLSKPFYDGEFSTNNNLQSVADYEKSIAELVITAIKSGKDVREIQNIISA